MVTKTLAALAFVGLFACLNAETRAAAVPAAPAIAVFYSFDKAPVPSVLAEMKEELTRILAPSGVDLTWRPIEENRGSENYPEVVVLRFRGSCEAHASVIYNEMGQESGIHELAETHRTNGKVLPFADVQCDQLRRYLSPVTAAEKSGDRNGVLGRAMARVVAHEMYHMLTGSSTHAKQGIARASHSREDLTAKTFDFGRPEINWLRDWRSRSVAAAEGLSPSDLPVSGDEQTDSGR